MCQGFDNGARRPIMWLYQPTLFPLSIRHGLDQKERKCLKEEPSRSRKKAAPFLFDLPMSARIQVSRSSKLGENWGRLVCGGGASSGRGPGRYVRAEAIPKPQNSWPRKGRRARSPAYTLILTAGDVENLWGMGLRPDQRPGLALLPATRYLQ